MCISDRRKNIEVINNEGISFTTLMLEGLSQLNISSFKDENERKTETVVESKET